MWPFIAIAVLLALVFVIAALWRSDRGRYRTDINRLETARARQETKAQTYHQKLRAVSETSGAAVVMIDSNGSVVHTNTTGERMFATKSGEMLGKSLIQTTLSSELLDFGLQAAKSGGADSKDILMPGAVGQILRVSAFPFPIGLSGDSEVMLVIVDVTELRRLETIRRDFVANVSHELRTPLASIRAMAETLEEGALHDEEVAQKFLSTIVREADRLARISEDLLILSDAESKAPEKEWFDLGVLIREVVARLESKAKVAKLSLEVHGFDSCNISGSRDQIEQVVVNLVDNAIKYTPEGGKVSVESKSTNGTVTVDVRDTGIGIMEGDLPRVFERFYRVDKARSRDSGGTGLGLSIVKNIIEAHGGEVRVKSEFNHGSTFTFILPIEGEQEKNAIDTNTI